MSVLCGYCHNLHDTVDDVKVCYGILPRQPAVPYSPHPPFVPSTQSQRHYVEILNGDTVYAAKLSKVACSSYIDELKRKGARVSPTPAPAPNPKLDMFKMLLPQVPDGRYAVREDDTQPYTFIRLKRHTHGKLNGCVTIQTQHSEKLMRAGIQWRNGLWTFEKPWIVDKMLVVCVDPEIAGDAYARELGRCRICGKELTDERSRWYGIGPDCETRHQGVIERVDERNGKSYEQAHRDLFV